jgi:hypothetical protein
MPGVRNNATFLYTLLTTLLAGQVLAGAEPGRNRAPRGVTSVLKDLYVDPARGQDDAPGTRSRPLATISAAVARLPDPLEKPVTISLAPATYDTTGGHGMSEGSLALMRRMRPGASVRIVGPEGGPPDRCVLGWEKGPRLIDVREGDWAIENVQIGTGLKRQDRQVVVTGPACLTLNNVAVRMSSQSAPGILAQRGGCVLLRGAIRLNDHVGDKPGEDSFCGIEATDHGLVRFIERDGASLVLGNGNLDVSYYGVIRLGCETARITCHHEQANNLAVNNSGRIDLKNTETTLIATNERNTPIGLEHDGHILAEGAHIIIKGRNKNAIALQKASTLTCNDIELDGEFPTAIWASSGSMFVGRFLGDINRVDATTGANINIEEMKAGGKIRGPVTARRGAVISLPNGDVVR